MLQYFKEDKPQELGHHYVNQSLRNAKITSSRLSMFHFERQYAIF